MGARLGRGWALELVPVPVRRCLAVCTPKVPAHELGNWDLPTVHLNPELLAGSSSAVGEYSVALQYAAPVH